MDMTSNISKYQTVLVWIRFCLCRPDVLSLLRLESTKDENQNLRCINERC